MKNTVARSLSFIKASKTSIIITVFATVLVLLQVRSFVAPFFSAAPKISSEVIVDAQKQSNETKKSVPFVKIDEPGKPKRLVVPSLQMGLPIVTVPMKNGTWPVEEGVANFAEESSAFNGESGNSVLFGHNKPDAFRPMAQLKKGDVVYVQTSQYQFTYEVSEISTTSPKNVDVMKPGDGYELTLITCNGFFDEKRLIIKAILKEITQLNVKAS
jgi:LPXTG-site transpeptidase (sortase) family protein